MKGGIKNQKGFTLVEMIIAVAMISVFFTVVVAVMTRTLNTYLSIRQTTNAMKTADVLGSGMVKELEFAQDIEFKAEGMSYSVNKGSSRIPLNAAPVTSYTANSVVIEGKPEIFGVVFDSGFYEENSVRLQITRPEQRILSIDIQIIQDGSNEVLYTTKRTVYLYNIE